MVYKCTVRTINANYVDVINKRIFAASITFGKTIIEICQLSESAEPALPYCTPGFIDAHVHIESSMLTPQRFATMVIPHGTVGVVCDPHEIANVMGEEGVRFMMYDASKSPLHFAFAIPSCVPATPFETNGAEFGPDQIERLMPQGVALAEMMNYPGILANDPKMMAEMRIAKEAGKPVDGHIPGIVDDRLRKYVAAGVSTDHESFTLNEAKAKLALGMKILVREGSAARNLDELLPLFKTNKDSVMACTDDAHPDDIRDRGHIDKFYHRAKEAGVDVFDIFRILTLNPIEHYKLNVGRLQVGDNADFLLVDNLESFNISASYVNGERVYDRNIGLCFTPTRTARINNFADREFSEADFRVFAPQDNAVARVIGLVPDQLVTSRVEWQTKTRSGQEVEASETEDIMKIAVINRYDATAKVVNGFIRGTGLKGGAMASSIAHDSHNVVVIGRDAEAMKAAAEAMFKMKGGIVVAQPDGLVTKLRLPIAGLMTAEKWQDVALKYERLIAKARNRCGVTLRSPFMTMAFMSLLVIPSLKIGDKGLFDVDEFHFVDLFK